MELRTRVLALAETSAHDDAVDGWDPRWHVGPVQSRSAHERQEALAWIERRNDDLEWLYQRLEDDASRDLLVRLLAHRIAGSRHVVLGPGRETAARLTEFASTALAAQPSPDGLPRYELSAIGLDLTLIAAPMFAVHTFLLEQYRHPDIPAANAAPGHVAVDGGAFWGDTSFWLAEQIAPDGRVIAFEPDPSGRAVLERNLAANPGPAHRIEVRPEALWDSATSLELTPQGGASIIGPGRGDVPAVTLDDLVAAGEIPPVDFVKLDVEGAELHALRGAAGLIRGRRPRLAIAIYHRPDDLVEIPRLLDDLSPSYRLALTHRSLHQYDTILFAWT